MMNDDSLGGIYRVSFKYLIRQNSILNLEKWK